MSKKELYRDDLLNRFAGHSFEETVIGSMIMVEFKDAGLVVIAQSQKMDATDAYKEIRENLIGTAAEVMFCITEVQ